MISTPSTPPTTSAHPLAAFCKARGLKITSTPRLVDRDTLDAWQRTASLWQVQLTYRGRTLTTPYWQGAAYVSKTGKPLPPTVDAVVASLLLDTQGVEDRSFVDWCGDYGANKDSIKYRAAFDACVAGGAALRKLLGIDYNAFVEAARDY